MNKKLVFVGVLAVIMISLTLTGCVLQKTDYHAEHEGYVELMPKDYQSQELVSFIRSKENIYTGIIVLNFLTIGLSFFYIIKYFLIESELDSSHKLLIILVNFLATGLAVISFDAVHFASFFVNKYGEVPYSLFEILVYEIIAIAVIIFSIWLSKFLRKKHREQGNEVKFTSESKKWSAWWNN